MKSLYTSALIVIFIVALTGCASQSSQHTSFNNQYKMKKKPITKHSEFTNAEPGSMLYEYQAHR